MYIDDTISSLNDLIQILEDDRKGFASAALELTRDDLRRLFRTRAFDCRVASSELQTLVILLGGRAKHGGSVPASIQDGSTKATPGHSDITMLDDAERAEACTQTAYARALGTTLPTAIRTVLNGQRAATLRSHELIRKLRGSCAAGVQPLPC